MPDAPVIQAGPAGEATDPALPEPAPEQADDCLPSREEFVALQREVESAARDWGVRLDMPEGRFISAMLGAIGWSGRLTLAGRASIREVSQQHREALAMELASAREVTRSAQIALNQARNAQIGLQVEQENVLVRMVEKTLPLFIERMKGVLVLREKRLNDDIRRRKQALAGLVALAVFLSGYALCAWQDWDATSAVYRCLAHPLKSGGNLYCDVIDFGR